MSGFPGRYSVSSDPLRTERRVELAAVVLALIVGLQLLLGGFSVIFRSAPEPVLPTPESLQVGTVKELVRPTADQRSQIRQRPLFWASRQPLELVDDEAARQAAEKQQKRKPVKISGVKLMGVFGAGDSAGIIVRSKGEKRRVVIGEALGDWRLESVTPIEATFRRKGERATLQLDRGEPIVSDPGPSAPEHKETSGESAEKAAPMTPGSLTLGGGARSQPKKRKKQ